MQISPTKLSKLILLAACSSTPFAVNAEEFIPTDQVAVQLPIDEVVQEVIDAPRQVLYREPPSNVLQNYVAEKGWGDVYAPGKFRVMKIGQTSFSTRDPKLDPQFMIKRANATTIATLNAKAEIIKTIRTQMSASDMMTMPGSDIQAQLDAERIALEEQIAALEYEIGDIEGLIDEQELNRIGALDWQDRAEAIADAVIKKLDAGYDPNALQEEQKAQFDQLVAQVKAAKSEKDELIDRAEALKGSIAKESKTSVQSLAEMPLYGTLTLATEEYFDASRDAYEVAVLVVWSQKNELRTRSILTGEFKGELNHSQKELLQHVNANKANLPSMLGSSLFKDSTGNLWAMGIGASEIRGNNIDPVIGKARIQAQQQVAVGLFANINTKAEYERIVRESVKDASTGSTEAMAVESFASSMSQEFKNRTISGAGEVFGYRIKHPVSEKEIYVSVYAVSAASTEAVKHIEKINYEVNREDIKAQKQSKAVEATLKQASLKVERATFPQTLENDHTKKIVAPAKTQTNNTGSGYRAELNDDDF